MRINDGGYGRYIERLQLVPCCLKTLRIKWFIWRLQCASIVCMFEVTKA